MTNLDHSVQRNELDNAVRELALLHAPKQIANCGDIVVAQAGWKQRHNVQITRIAVEVASIDVSIARRAELGLSGWLMVQYEYIGRRLKANGELAGQPHMGFLLSKFVTLGGQNYERIPSGFNHVGLVFEIESLATADEAGWGTGLKRA